MKILQKILLLLLPAFFLATGMANAFDVIDDSRNGSERDLFVIFEDIFDEHFDSSDDLYDAYGLPDDDDDWWEEKGTGFVKITVRYAGYDQALWVIDENYNEFPVALNIQQGMPSVNLTKYIFVDNDVDFVFVEKLSGSGSGVGPWYSDDRNSPNVDHFLAFDVLDKYNEKYDSDVDHAWLIAFEDLRSGGDYDYNDLVALIVNVDPIPTFAEEIIVSARPGSGKIAISWTAVSEENVLGYNMLRRKGIAGTFVQINDNLIHGKGSIETTVNYEYVDDDVKNRRLYQYKLVEVETNGDIKIHGPVKAVPGLIYDVLGR